MLLIPSGSKYRKSQKGRKGKIRNVTFACSSLHRGDFGLKAISAGRINSAQIESTRLAIRRELESYFKRRDAFVDIRFFPHKPVSKKAIGIRMGGGKGAPESWDAVISPGRILFEIGGNLGSLSEIDARKILKAGAYKLPIKTKIVSRYI